ncbi:unnamed protein product [Aphanomyces euteiches]
MFNDSDGSNKSGDSRTTFEVETEQLKNSVLFTDLYLLNAGKYNEMLEASASAAVSKAITSESAADIALARNFVAIMADGEAKTELVNSINAIAVPYTVTFKDWNGDDLKTEKVKHGDKATAPTQPSRTGYTFVGWSVGFTNVKSDLIVTAKYDAVPYTISFDSRGGSPVGNVIAYYDTLIGEPEAPSLEDHTLEGWYRDEARTEKWNFANDKAPAKDMTLYAKWTTIITYTVTFQDWNGTVLKTETVKQGDNATAPTQPSRTGYTFVGWSVGFTNVISNLTVMAKYDAVPGNPSNPGTVWVPPSTEVNVDSRGNVTVDSSGNVTISSTPKINYSTNIAETILSQNEFENAFGRATGKSNQITVKLSNIENAKGYASGLPTSWFKGDSDRSVVIETSFGTVELSSAMLTAAQLQDAGQTVTIVVSQADKSGWSQRLIDQIGDHPVLDLLVLLDNKAIAWNNSEAPVTIMMPYTPTALEKQNADQLVVWYVDGEGNVKPVPNGRYDSATGQIVFQTSHFSHYAVAYAAPKFSDLSRVAWAAKEIEALAARGVVEGTSATTFDPGTAISRGEFLAQLIRFLGLDAEFTDSFIDVSTSSPYYKELGIGRALGIVEGVGGNKFLPDSEISREDVSVIIKRALDQWHIKLAVVSSKKVSDFADAAKTANYAKDGLNYLLSVGLLQGTSGNNLNPKGNLTRAEASVILYRIFKQSH